MMKTQKTAHSFHIPAMGTGFTIDTPLKLARYGISSVISLVDDTLIEQMRKFYCEKTKEPYQPIVSNEEDARARRITAYLNLLDTLLSKQVHHLQNSSFEKGSEISRYYEMLPDTPIKQLYLKLLSIKDPTEKKLLQDRLRKLAVPGTIDVNIMTKLDRDHYDHDKKLPTGYSDALAALRGYANSTLNSAVVFSAGFNPRLYGYLSQFKDFLPNEKGVIKKRVILKVSDYRSAFIQGKYLAKRGIWVSEYRIESALNCGGHAFVNDGSLMGPILEEFKSKKDGLIETLHNFYSKALKSHHSLSINAPLKTAITAQGGVGTSDEHAFLMKHYHLDSVGWGTPFMLVPEAINIDNEHLQKLIEANDEGSVYLSGSSPLGIPFWNLSTSASEEDRRKKIASGKPGSTCPKKFAENSVEFTKRPICIASARYQKLKLAHLPTEGWTTKQLQLMKEKVLAKSCICHDLAGSATKKYGIDKEAKTAICPGPNIVNFFKVASLQEMIDHIYGRDSLLSSTYARPHMFVKELSIHIDYLKKEATEVVEGIASRAKEKLNEVKSNLLSGIEYYQKMGKKVLKEQQDSLLENLLLLKKELECLAI